jgi:hypothetical protein
VVGGRCELEELLCRLLAHVGACDVTSKTLDLVGHSSGHVPLVLGDWAIDAERASVRAFFRELADHRVLPRLGVTAMRLLGCSSAGNTRARDTLARLSDILELDVYGTRDSVTTADYDHTGFKSEHLLVGGRRIATEGTPYRRNLDIETLPAEPLSGGRGWPLQVVDADRARQILALVLRSDGAEMPCFNGHPETEIAMPAIVPGRYLRFDVLLDGAFVRVYPDGAHRPGIVFPVSAPATLRALLA